MFKRWTLRDMLERERDLRIEAEIRAMEYETLLDIILGEEDEDDEPNPES